MCNILLLLVHLCGVSYGMDRQELISVHEHSFLYGQLGHSTVSPTLQRDIIVPASQQGDTYRIPQSYQSPEKLVEIIKAADSLNLYSLRMTACNNAITYIKQHGDTLLDRAALWTSIDQHSQRTIATALMQHYEVEDMLWRKIVIPKNEQRSISKLFSSRTPSCVVYSPHGKLIVFALSDGTIYKKELNQESKLFGSQPNGICALVMPNDQSLIAGCARGEITVWDVARATIVHTLKAHQKSVKNLFYVSDLNYLVSVSNDHKKLKSWKFQASDFSLEEETHLDQTKEVQAFWMSSKNMVILQDDNDKGDYLVFCRRESTEDVQFRSYAIIRSRTGSPYRALLVLKHHNTVIAEQFDSGMLDVISLDRSYRSYSYGEKKTYDRTSCLVATDDEKFMLHGYDSCIDVYEVNVHGNGNTPLQLLFTFKLPSDDPVVQLAFRPESYEFVVRTKTGLMIVNPEFPQFNLEQLIFIAASCITGKIDTNHSTYLMLTEEQRNAVFLCVANENDEFDTIKYKYVLEEK